MRVAKGRFGAVLQPIGGSRRLRSGMVERAGFLHGEKSLEVRKIETVAHGALVRENLSLVKSYLLCGAAFVDEARQANSPPQVGCESMQTLLTVATPSERESEQLHPK